MEAIEIVENAFPRFTTNLDHFQVRVKILRVKTYLELCLSGEGEEADEPTRNAIRDFAGYLERYFASTDEHFHSRFQRAYHTFLLFCRTLYTFRNYPYLDHKEEIEGLISDIRRAETVLARSWLLDKAVGMRR